MKKSIRNMLIIAVVNVVALILVMFIESRVIEIFLRNKETRMVDGRSAEVLIYLVNLFTNTIGIVFFLIIARLLKNGSKSKVKNILCILAIGITIFSFIRIEFDNILNLIYEIKDLKRVVANSGPEPIDYTDEMINIENTRYVFCWISFAIATINLILFIINFIKGLTYTENSIESNDKENNLQEYKEE